MSEENFRPSEKEKKSSLSPPSFSPEKPEKKEKILSKSESEEEELSPEARAAEIIKTSSSPSRKILPIILSVIGSALGLLILFFSYKLLFPRVKNLIRPKEVKLVYWGLWEPNEVLDSIINEFQKENPHIKIEYRQQYHKDYRERLQSALAGGEGPDIFRFHNTWLPMFKNELAPVPPEVFDAAEFETTFYPIVKKDLRYGTNYYGIPLMFDSLSLFINKEIFEAAGKVPPKTWDDLRRLAIELRTPKTGAIQIAGVALGETSNVDHWSDILGLLMLQNGANLARPTGELAEDALTFYTLFSKTDHVWDKSLPPSTYAFATGKLAMYFAPSWRVFTIKEINPDLRFEILPVPQLSEEKVSWATYWVEGVSKKSQYQKEAWQFLKFLSQKETLEKFYSEASKIRSFGEIPSRVDMAELYQSNPLVAPFLQQAPYAQSWYLASRTWDRGINDKIIKYFEDAVNAVLEGKSVKNALQTCSQGVAQVLSQYQTSY